MLDGLVGNWDFERTISGQAGMNGTATVAARADGLLSYREQGQLHLAGSTYAFTRNYLYRARPNGFDVLFDEAEPRLFQAVDLVRDGDHWAGTAQHHCSPDLYVSQYRLELPHRLDIVHAVSGPKKRYVSTTRFCRRP